MTKPITKTKVDNSEIEPILIELVNTYIRGGLTNYEQATEQINQLIRKERSEAIASYKKINKIHDKELNQLLIQARQNEIATSCLAGVGGLTPQQQKYFENRLAELERQLK